MATEWHMTHVFISFSLISLIVNIGNVHMTVGSLLSSWGTIGSVSPTPYTIQGHSNPTVTSHADESKFNSIKSSLILKEDFILSIVIQRNVRCDQPLIHNVLDRWFKSVRLLLDDTWWYIYETPFDQNKQKKMENYMIHWLAAAWLILKSTEILPF